MTDQGWMVDDGTCDLCVRGQCWQCIKRSDDGWCCCGEDYQFELATTTEGDWP
jgi:hypothetical protein